MKTLNSHEERFVLFSAGLTKNWSKSGRQIEDQQFKTKQIEMES